MILPDQIRRKQKNIIIKLLQNMKKENINAAYKSARERYAAVGVDTDKALEKMDKISL